MKNKTENKEVKNKMKENTENSKKVTEKQENKQKEQEDIQKTQDNKKENTANAENTQENQGKETDELTDLQKKYNELNDKYLRLSAEFDNYRKRTLKEKMDLTKNAGEEILTQLLPVMDNFERALKSIDESKDIDAVKEGIHLIYQKFKEFLTNKGIKEIEIKDGIFDADLHEAVTKIPAPDESLKGKIVDVIEKGYKLNDKVVRYAKVVVGE